MIGRHDSDGGLDIEDVAIALAPTHQEREGLLAWANLRVGPFQLNGLAIRRRLDGALIVTYPARKDPRGGLHRSITPLDPELDRRIRAAVTDAYLDVQRAAGREDRR